MWVEGPRQLADFHPVGHVGLMVEIAGLRDLLRDLHQLIQRDCDRPGRFIRDPYPKTDRHQRAEERDCDGVTRHVLVGVASFLNDFLIFPGRLRPGNSAEFLSQVAGSFCR